MAWRLAKSLEVLRKQINDNAPNRSKTSDGTIGDAAHASRSSDHNPWVKNGSTGIVTALDITHDPRNGVDSEILANTLRLSGDPRIKYVISKRKIANSGGDWRRYTGSNPHNHHCHVSVNSSAGLYDSEKSWDLSAMNFKPSLPIITKIKEVIVGKPEVKPVVKLGSTGQHVRNLQKALGLTVDGIFGAKTKKAVIAFQKKNKLVADGVVGTYTWDKL